MDPPARLPQPTPRLALISAAAGACLWTLFALFVAERVERLALLAPLVITPLALGVVAARGEETARVARLGALARRAQPLAAALALPMFVLPTGPRAAACAAAWLAFTALLARYGLARLASRRGRGPLPELCIDAGLLYIAVGGAWLFAARAGLRVMGFDPTITLLTGVHFHYAGFAAPVLAGATGRALAAPSRVYAAGALGAAAGPGLIAAGFVLSPAMELASAVLLAACLLLLAGVNVLRARRAIAGRLARGLLVVSSLSLLVTMAYACVYAYGRFAGRTIVAIPEMAQVHGMTNAIGFATCGLLAWTLAPRAAER